LLAVQTTPAFPRLRGRFRSLIRDGLALRLIALAILFGAEYAATALWPSGRQGYRLKASVVTFAAIFFTFSYLRNGPELRLISRLVSKAPIDRVLFAGHFGAMALYGVSWVYWEQLGTVGAPMRWVSGGSGLVLAACAFVPLRLWLRLIRETGWLWFYALTASIAAFVAVDYLRPFWSLTFFEQATFALVRTFLTPMVRAVVADPHTHTIGTPTFAVEISPSCSGFEGVGLLLAFVSVWLWLFRRDCRFPQALVLIPAGAVGAFLLNAVRITVLILIGNAGAPAIAMGGFHTAAGWCLFCGAALGCSVYAHRIGWLTNTQPEVHQTFRDSFENPAATYLLPFCSILVAGLVATLTESDFDWLYPARFVAAAGVLWVLRKKYGGLDWKFGWLGPAIGVLTFALWIGVDSFQSAGGHDSMPQALAASSAPGRVAWIVIRVLSAIVTVPIAEELAFRGFLMRRLASAEFESVPLNKVTWLGLGISSLLFGVLHGNLWFAGILAGILYGWAAMRRGRFGDAVIAHATTNALLAVYVLAFHQWHLW
jgi:exosortase E/protease (VPEID-CTERM system)